MKALAIREKLLAIRRQRVEVRQAIERAVARTGDKVDAFAFGKACLLTRNSAFKALRNRMMRRGAWTAVCGGRGRGGKGLELVITGSDCGFRRTWNQRLSGAKVAPVGQNTDSVQLARWLRTWPIY